MAINARDERQSSPVTRLPRRDSTPNVSEAPAGPYDVVDLMQLWATVSRNYRFVLAVALLVFGVVMYRTLTSPMEFLATGRLYLGELDGKSYSPSAPNALEFSGSGQGELGSEIEIISSRSLVSRAILAAGMNVSITPSAEEPPVYWRWLLSRRDPELLDPGLRDLRAVNALLSDRVREGVSYTVRFTDPDSYEVLSDEGRVAAGKLGEPLRTPTFELTLVPGKDRSPKAGAQYSISLKPLEDVTDEAVGRLEVHAPKGSAGPVNVVTLDFSESSPRVAASFLENLMLAYLKERQSWKTEDASAAESFVTGQLRTIRETLDSVQKQLADYRTNNRVVVLDNEARAMIEQIARYEEQRVAARLQVAALGDVKRSLASRGAPMGAYLLGESNDTVFDGLSASLSQARQKLTDLESRFNPAAPDVQEQRAQVNAQLEAIQNYVSSRLNRAQETLGALTSIIGQFEGKLRTVPAAELGLAQLSRESEVYSRTYSYLLERQQQAAIVKASTLSKNRILDLPRVPDREESPKLALSAASGFVGLVLGVGLVLLHSMFAGTLQSDSDVHRSIGGTAVWGRIPRRRRQRGTAGSRSRLFELPASHPQSRFVEAFRSLRSSLYQWGSASNGEPTVVLVTSPSRGDGKTTCVSWLAFALAADGRRVLTIDANIRTARTAVGAELKEQGLCSVLTREGDWRELVQKVTLPFGEYHSLSAGGAAPAELLSGSTMSEFLKEARKSFDFILIDSPSFPFVSDALMLASNADTVISVMRLQNTARKLAVEHARRLGALPSTFAVAINDAGPSPRAKSDLANSEASNGGGSDGSSRPSMLRRRSWWLAAGLVIAIAGVAALAHQGLADQVSAFAPWIG